MLDELVPHSDRPDIPAPREYTTHNISEGELKAIVWRLKNKAPGADGLTAKIIRAAWPEISLIMISLVNECLRKATFPDTWKHAKVVVLLREKTKSLSYQKATASMFTGGTEKDT